MATTTNFGWETPDDTDLVKDGAAAIRTALGGVDTSFVDLKGGTTGQVLAKASNTDLDFVWSADAAGMTNPMTTTGDTIYSSSGSTPARLGVGSSGQVLTVSGGVPTWATPASGSMTELASGSMSSTAVSLTSISGSYQDLVLVVYSPTWATANDDLAIRVNNDTGSNYLTSRTTSSTTNTLAYISGGQQVYNQANSIYITYFEQYANTSAYKQIHGRTIYRDTTPAWATDNRIGAWLSNTAINRIDILTGAGRTFNGGTYKLFGVK